MSRNVFIRDIRPIRGKNHASFVLFVLQAYRALLFWWQFPVQHTGRPPVAANAHRCVSCGDQKIVHSVGWQPVRQRVERQNLTREARNPIRASARKRSVVAPKRCAQDGKKFFRKSLTEQAGHRCAIVSYFERATAWGKDFLIDG